MEVPGSMEAPGLPEVFQCLSDSSSGGQPYSSALESISKKEATETLAELLSFRQFSFMKITALRRQYHGRLGLYQEQYRELSEYNTTRISELTSEDREDLLELLVKYFQWEDDTTVHDRLRQALFD
jgi:hypothetical protein